MQLSRNTGAVLLAGFTVEVNLAEIWRRGFYVARKERRKRDWIIYGSVLI